MFRNSTSNGNTQSSKCPAFTRGNITGKKAEYKLKLLAGHFTGQQFSAR